MPAEALSQLYPEAMRRVVKGLADCPAVPQPDTPIELLPVQSCVGWQGHCPSTDHDLGSLLCWFSWSKPKLCRELEGVTEVLLGPQT